MEIYTKQVSAGGSDVVQNSKESSKETTCEHNADTQMC